jgi:hypothetical protein
MFPRSGLFGYWFDSEWRQRDDINDLAAESGATAFSVDALQRQVAQLRPMVYELSATVAVLVKMLAEAGQLDPTVVQYRVEAELEERRNPAPRPPQAPDAPDAPRMIHCSKCLRMVHAERTIMTANGAICDPVCAP